MTAQINDRRHQLEANNSDYVLIGGRDSAMSGWGKGVDGSYAFWSVPRWRAPAMIEWVKARGEFKHVKQYDKIPYKPAGHISVYAYNEKHPAFDSE